MGAETLIDRAASADDLAAAYAALEHAHGGGAASDAELSCGYVLLHIRKASGPRWLQGPRRPALGCAVASPLARSVADSRLWRIELAVARALVRWAEGRRPARLLREIPTAAELLALQARGERCVALLPDGTPTQPHADGLAFVVHDLCHLEKFVDEAHYLGQVGFFRTLHDAFADRRWAPFEADFDAAWAADRDHVAADMNGSAIFLFSALKMKLKMAARRRLARRGRTPPVAGGPLTAEEDAAFDDALREMLELLGLRGAAVRAAAVAVSTRREEPEAARVLLGHFAELGREVLGARYGGSLGRCRATS